MSKSQTSDSMNQRLCGVDRVGKFFMYLIHMVSVKPIQWLVAMPNVLKIFEVRNRYIFASPLS